MTGASVFAAGEVEVTPIWQPFLDVANDVRPWIQFRATPGNTQLEAKLTLITESACYWVQNYLGKPIAPTILKRRFSGWTGYNGSYIALPYYPVLAVKKVVEFRGISGPFELTEQTPENQGTGPEVYAVDPLKGLVIRVFQGLIQRPWFPGTKNIEIEWEAGYNPVPPDIRKATLALIKHEWNREQQASQSGGPLPAGVEAENMMPGYFGEPPEVRRTLDQYKQIGIG